MKVYGVYVLVLRMETLESCCKQLHLVDALTTPNFVTEEYMRRMAELFEGLREPCENLFADSTLISQIDALAQVFRAQTVDKRPAVLCAQFQTIRDGIHHNLEKRKFMILSEEEAGFYGNFNVFGESFKEKYPARALGDGLQAGNCYAAGLHTACVFHCMRVAEYGLRKLAANSMLRVKITDRKKPCPIEYGTWDKVIAAIRNKIAKIRQRPNGFKKEGDLQFFSTAADHCEYMKDIWRNEISHTRRSYKKEEALSVINRVKEFVTVVGNHKGSVISEDSLQRLMDAAKIPPPTPYSRLAALAALAPQSKTSSLLSSKA